jgi:hypothetical protein
MDLVADGIYCNKTETTFRRIISLANSKGKSGRALCVTYFEAKSFSEVVKDQDDTQYTEQLGKRFREWAYKQITVRKQRAVSSSQYANACKHLKGGECISLSIDNDLLPVLISPMIAYVDTREKELSYLSIPAFVIAYPQNNVCYLYDGKEPLSKYKLLSCGFPMLIAEEISSFINTIIVDFKKPETKQITLLR